jgi:hypothetical protein
MRWRSTDPLLLAPDLPGDRAIAIKDPSVLAFGGRWHVFATVRAEARTHRIEYLRFDRLDRPVPERFILDLGADLVAAPQVFLHRRDGRFFMILQAKGPFPYGPAYSTNESLDPAGWSAARPLYATTPEAIERWLDFWVIADGDRTHLFFTSLDGKMWRAETASARFPHGFGPPSVALEADLFEASHVYRFGEAFIAFIEAKRLGRRYQRVFAARALDGAWTHAFDVGSEDVAAESPWTRSISHGELIRASANERMEVRPGLLRYLYQGAPDLDVALRAYDRVPWRIGLLESLRPLGVDEILGVLR